MNESEQAQGIAEIKERHNVADRIRKRGDAHILTPLEFTEAHVDRYYLLEIVDSQAQKIKEARLWAANLREALQVGINEAAKELGDKNLYEIKGKFPWEKP